jgi:hypothetical protein
MRLQSRSAGRISIAQTTCIVYRFVYFGYPMVGLITGLDYSLNARRASSHDFSLDHL